MLILHRSKVLMQKLHLLIKSLQKWAMKIDSTHIPIHYLPCINIDNRAQNVFFWCEGWVIECHLVQHPYALLQPLEDIQNMCVYVKVWFNEDFQQYPAHLGHINVNCFIKQYLNGLTSNLNLHASWTKNQTLVPSFFMVQSSKVALKQTEYPHPFNLTIQVRYN